MKKISFIVVLFVFLFFSLISVDNLMAKAHIPRNHRRPKLWDKLKHETCDKSKWIENQIDIQDQGRDSIKAKIYLRGIQAQACPPEDCGHHLSRNHQKGNDKKNKFKHYKYKKKHKKHKYYKY
jgi:hypothetical protein